MGSLILCYKKKAKQPYEITRIHRKIYTIEELCYYLCNNLYLIDYTIMNEQLCDWLEEELSLTELAQNLRQSLKQYGSVEQFVVTILAYASIYTTTELRRIQNVLEQLKNQKEIERKKYKADNLLESGAVKPAILIYQSIIHGAHDDSVDGKFYGRVYGCLGAAYGKIFLYEEAAKMYEAAFQICEEESMRRAYLYCCKKSMSSEKYAKLLEKNEIYQLVDQELRNEIEELKKQSRPILSEEMLGEWKEQYRRLGTGEI